MARYNGHYVYEIVDVNGDTATVRIPINDSDAGTLALLVTQQNTFGALLGACTNGKVIGQLISFKTLEAQFLVGTSPPNNAEYSSVTDGARLQFGNGQGSRASMTIPAPLESCFGANSNVVDPTNANVAALIAAYEADAADAAGSSFNLYKGGVKTGRGARRRRSALVP